MATLEGEKEYVRVIEADLPLSHLKPYFMDWESVLEHHVDEMSLKYSAHVHDPVCQGCGKGKTTERRRYFWKATYDTKELIQKSLLTSLFTMMFGHLKHYYGSLEFSTVHCLCSPCSRGIRIKATAGELVGKLATGLFWLSLLGLVCFVCLEGYYLSSRARLHDHLVALGCLATAGASMAFALWAMQVRRQWGIPGALRKVAKSPFQLDSIQDM